MNETTPLHQTSGRLPKLALTASAAMVGLSAIVTQIILLREFLNILYGNELIVGLLLFEWMLFTGAGAWLSQYLKPKTVSLTLLGSLQILMALLPLILALGLYLARSLGFPYGTTPDVNGMLGLTAAILLPYTLLSGCLFPLHAEIFRQLFREDFIARIYSWESAGSAAGAIVFSVIWIHWLGSFESLMALMVVHLFMVFLLGMAFRRQKMMVAPFLIATVVVPAFVIWRPDYSVRQQLFPGQTIIAQADTPYGNITITEQAEQKNIFLNHTLMLSSQEITADEEAVHYAMIQPDTIRRALIIGAGQDGIFREAMKYHPARLDYAEANPWLIALTARYGFRTEHDCVHVQYRDGRLFLKENPWFYEAVLILMPEPATLQLNRFYTAEFFREAKAHLTRRGVLALRVNSSADYMSAESRLRHSALFRTLKTAFRNVIIIQGQQDYFIASDGPLTPRVTKRLEMRGIETVYVNGYYLQDDILERRSEWIARQLDSAAAINTDFRPVAYFYQIRLWLSSLESTAGLAGVIMVLLIAVFCIRRDSLHWGVAVCGLTASTAEVLLMIGLQIFYGYLYQWIGLIIALFMLGLYAGARLPVKVSPDVACRRFKTNQLLLMVYLLLLPPVFYILAAYIHLDAITPGVIWLLTLCVAFIVGYQFNLSVCVARGSDTDKSARLYGADLIGSATGALVTTVIGLPLLGLTAWCVLCGLLVGLSALMIRRTDQSFTAKGVL